jgi:hypothetical protein
MCEISKSTRMIHWIHLFCQIFRKSLHDVMCRWEFQHVLSLTLFKPTESNNIAISARSTHILPITLASADSQINKKKTKRQKNKPKKPKKQTQRKQIIIF